MKIYVPQAEDKIIIDSDFEGGVLERAVRLGENYYQLILRPDVNAKFYFRIRGCKGRNIVFQFTCRDGVSPEEAEGNYRWVCSERVVKPVITYDHVHYGVVDQCNRDRSLLKGLYVFEHTFTEDEAYISSARPYVYSDLLAFIDSIKGHPLLTIGSAGVSRNGIDVPMLTITRNPNARKAALFIAREDAEEVTGSFAIEGIIRQLLSGEHEKLLDEYVFKIIPMVCVDGVIAGSVHSAGYGYGGFRYEKRTMTQALDAATYAYIEEKIPVEIENVRRFFFDAFEKYEVQLVGRLHGAWSLEPIYPVDCSSADRELLLTLISNTTKYWRGTPSPVGLGIRPKGFPERLLLDTYGFYSCFACHVQGETPEDLNQCGADLFKACGIFLNKKIQEG